MPKIVDHGARRAELARAMWRVVYRDGVGAATVRSIAAEAGWSPSALRHYFATQTELLVFAMEHVQAEAAERIAADDRTGGPREVAQRILEQLLPLDRQRVREAEVWLLLAARAQTDPAARTRMADADDGIRRAAEFAVALLTGQPAADPEAVARLHALLDGLALHALLYPERMPPARARELLGAHLDTLVAS
ncbi:TetR family transcriptional regulator C-terminal domain-containing protein [Micromonospora tulbaghiae]|uniref:TetR family transcriptional regulator C-terminal domain-containing protein n=1 Tax=Micromonospora tulbaghiae TaxID=479978 RepID=A0AAW4JEL4_9ACTN|nr:MULTISPECIES: TetR family transcriptional regulator C-terminal domain-containing protein [Micromonospora]KAB1906559.1 TetR family transcriptional regulator [Micromonospora sp. AMSO1212t]MBO4139790.1 TetR family transcriptional regulator C-terminal domain-containing protein [Micromonospora tulbaghiae]MDX5458750.1 TetR family transcriptional regulator C-terminal domain-containing protein [Micromonospora tulbaghiae]SCE78367.1 transcriptional regulator, TetR family [Micromonospora tulbaghiae]